MDATSLFGVYLLAGVAVTAASPPGPARWLTPVLWPLFLPGLLTSPGEQFDSAPPAEPEHYGIANALDRLERAVTRWNPNAVFSLVPIEDALLAMERRRSALAAWLDNPVNRPTPVTHDAAKAAQEERNAHLDSLRTLHERLDGELEAALARIEELTVRMDLAHFQGQALADVAGQLDALKQHVVGVCEADAEVHAL